MLWEFIRLRFGTVFHLCMHKSVKYKKGLLTHVCGRAAAVGIFTTVSGAFVKTLKNVTHLAVLESLIIVLTKVKLSVSVIINKKIKNLSLSKSLKLPTFERLHVKGSTGIECSD